MYIHIVCVVVYMYIYIVAYISIYSHIEKGRKKEGIKSFFHLSLRENIDSRIMETTSHFMMFRNYVE